MISVIIPAYNSAHFILETIRSILSQTYSDIEIIVIDDGSSDNTHAVLADHIKQKQIIYILQQNQGPAAARNNGVKHAQGEFIAFVDADDIWLPNKLAEQICLFDHDETGLVYSGIEMFDSENGHTIKTKTSNINGHVFEQLLINNFIPTSTVLIRRQAFENFYTGTEFYCAEDYDLWLKISRKWRIASTNSITCKHRKHMGSLSSNLSKMYKDELTVKRQYIGQVKRPLMNQALAAVNYNTAYDEYKRRHILKSLSYLWQAIKYHPWCIKYYKLLIRNVLQLKY